MTARPSSVNTSRRIGATLTTLAAAAALGACALGPDYAWPEAPLPAAFHNAPAVQARDAAPPAAPLDAWWQGFDDPQLTRVIERVASRNLDLAQARARLAQARAAADAAGAALLPSAGLQAERARVDQSLLDPTATVARGSPAFERGFSLSQADAVASWEIDLFGGLRRGREAARADYEAALAGNDALRVALTAEAADAYLQLRDEQLRLAVALRQEAIDEQLVALVTQRLEQGLSSERELHEARAVLEDVRSTMPPLRAGAEAQLQRLRVLMGDFAADSRFALEVPVALPAVPALSPADGQAALLRRRPDVIAAERRVAAANARIGVALAEYYPHVSVSALFGVASIEPGHLFTGDAVEHQLGAGLRWRLFDFGRVDAEVAAARGRDAEALAAYRATVLRASSEVEVALSELVQQEARIASLTRETQELQLARDQSQAAYEGGAVSLIDVLTADRQLLAASDQLTIAQAGAARAAVAGYRALGGGWQAGERVAAAN